MDILNGKKTIATGIAMVIFAVVGVALGKVDIDVAVQLAGTGLGLIFVRLGIAKEVE